MVVSTAFVQFRLLRLVADPIQVMSPSGIAARALIYRPTIVVNLRTKPFLMGEPAKITKVVWNAKVLWILRMAMGVLLILVAMTSTVFVNPTLVPERSFVCQVVWPTELVTKTAQHVSH
jgi:hypothetical protein